MSRLAAQIGAWAAFTAAGPLALAGHTGSALIALCACALLAFATPTGDDDQPPCCDERKASQR